MWRLKNISWENIVLDALVLAFFRFGYQPIEQFVLGVFSEYFWYAEALQLYVFALMVALYVFDRATARSKIDGSFAAESIPQIGYAFVGLGGIWLMFAGFQFKINENWLAGILIMAHFLLASIAALIGATIAAIFRALRLSRLTAHLIAMVQITAGFIALEACFAAVIEHAGGGNAGLAFRATFFIWGLATFLPLRIFLLIKPPFHPLEVATALAAYIMLFRTAVA